MGWELMMVDVDALVTSGLNGRKAMVEDDEDEDLKEKMKSAV